MSDALSIVFLIALMGFVLHTLLALYTRRLGDTKRTPAPFAAKQTRPPEELPPLRRPRHHEAEPPPRPAHIESAPEGSGPATRRQASRVHPTATLRAAIVFTEILAPPRSLRGPPR